MSSVTRFIRQVQPHTTYYSASAVIASPSTTAYELVPTAGAAATGNYPAGTMSTNVTALNDAIVAASTATATSGRLMLRDMGKTVRAPLTVGGNVGFFRQVQLVAPSAITAAQGYAGGAAGVSFGVLGSASAPDAYTAYLTFYIPVAVAGMAAPVVSSHIASGQM